MSKFDTHGGYFAPKDYTRVNAGGTHEENPNGGVQLGVDEQGIPNMLEEGEPVYKDYVFSDNIKASKKFLENNNIPLKYEGQLYSEIADSFFAEAENRPNDPISRNGLDAMLGRIADAQEQQKEDSERRKLERELSKLSPEELQALEQELMSAQEAAVQQEQVTPEQPMAPAEQVPVEQPVEGVPVEQQVPVMANGGLLRKFEDGGDRNLYQLLDLDKAAQNQVRHDIFDSQPTLLGERLVHYLRNRPSVSYPLAAKPTSAPANVVGAVEPPSYNVGNYPIWPMWNTGETFYDRPQATTAPNPVTSPGSASTTTTTTTTATGNTQAPARPRRPITPPPDLTDASKIIDDSIVNDVRYSGRMDPLGGPSINLPGAVRMNQPENPVGMPALESSAENTEQQRGSVLAPTFSRYAGAIGSGLLAAYNATQRPDRYTDTRVVPFVPTGHINLQNVRYNPVDNNMIQNQILAQGNSTQRALRNSGLGPSSAAAILAADNNTTGNIGTGFLQNWQANNQQRNAVVAANNQAEAQRAQFDYGVDSAKQRALAEAQYRNAYNDMMLQRMNYQAEADKYNALSNQINAGLEALSGIGRENFIRNQINTNTALNGYRTLGNGVGAYLPYNCGGLLKKYKK